MRVIPPVLLERICDAGRSSMDATAIIYFCADMVNKNGEAFMLAHPYFPGCGVRFQWYGLGGCFCPECGRQYQVTMEDYRAGKYTPEKTVDV